MSVDPVSVMDDLREFIRFTYDRKIIAGPDEGKKYDNIPFGTSRHSEAQKRDT